ncbi:MAG TPA: gliding motility-associated C-terminal domain-containing protein [Chryseosolibacter sp.]|nr:gliding motility-associated C-terminal domain-containing protein [Chryseosolibacter sp.]
MINLGLFRKLLIHTLFWLALIGLLFLHGQVYGQDNKKPKIKGQRELSTNEEQSLEIELTDLEVEDENDWFYPWGFTLTVYPGNNYNVSGRSITPVTNFNGELTVPVSVNDGEKESEQYNLKITVVPVNDVPVITGQQSIATTNTSSVTLTASHLVILDPDNVFPDDFAIIVREGNNYSVTGTKITPNTGFIGDLSVPVTTSDGQDESEIFNLVVGVKEGRKEPTILNQKPVTINEDEPYTIEFSDLEVADADSQYPDGFTLNIAAGDNYSVSEHTVIPTANFNGNIFATVRVHDGQYESNAFSFLITVKAVNDPPLTEIGTAWIYTQRGDDSVRIFDQLTITDPDSESISYAEVLFRRSTYIPGEDLVFFDNTNGISGIFEASTGSLTLIGKASVQEYQDALGSIVLMFPEGSAPIEESKMIYVSVNDGINDSETKEREIRITENPPGNAAFDIPSGFTPNGDAINDTWNIRPIQNVEKYSAAIIHVYSKSGLLVFESTGIEKEWDGRYSGTLLPPDVYYYIIHFPELETQSVVKGTVTILR